MLAGSAEDVLTRTLITEHYGAEVAVLDAPGSGFVVVPVRGTIPANSPRDLFDAENAMSKLLRGVAAGYGAKKLGGGCFSTVLIFIILS